MVYYLGIEEGANGMVIQLKYHSNVYLGKSILTKKLVKIKKVLEKHPLRSNVFLITKADNGIDELEIFHGRLLFQSFYQNNPPYIIGITSNYEEALEVLEQIVQECLKERGDCALREYLKC